MLIIVSSFPYCVFSYPVPELQFSASLKSIQRASLLRIILLW